MWNNSKFPLFVRNVCCFIKQQNLTRKKRKETLQGRGVDRKNWLFSCIIFHWENMIPFNCSETFFNIWRNTVKQPNYMHHFLNYEQCSYRLCIICWPSPVLLRLVKCDKTTVKVDLCRRLFVLSTQMVCHNAMSPDTVPSLFSFIYFTEVL